MIILKIFVETIILFQITTIIVDSNLFQILRDFLTSSKWILLLFIGQLLSCFLCTSVWVGFILSNCLYNICDDLGFHSFSWFFNSMFFSGLAWFIYLFEKKIDGFLV